MEPRLFNLDPQLLHDAVLLAIAVFVMFVFLSYILFNPAREMLKKRQDKVKDDIDSAEKSREDAAKLKEEDRRLEYRYCCELQMKDQLVDFIRAQGVKVPDRLLRRPY